MDRKQLDFFRAIRSRLSKHRYQHTLAVARQARKLAVHYGADVDKAVTAAMLHDITKEDSIQNQLKMLRDSDIIEESFLMHHPGVFHAITGCWVATHVFSTTDPQILDGIRYHTTARAGMSLLEKIVYVADKTSSDRQYQEVVQYRLMSFEDLDRCLFLLIQSNMLWLLGQEQEISIDTFEAYHAYRA